MYMQHFSLNTFSSRGQGSVYRGGHGAEERYRAATLHDEKAGVIMAMRCSEVHGSHLTPEIVEYCRRLRQGYDDHDYGNLLNTTFGLIPSGRSPSTYRLGEVMGAGAIPVIVARDVVLPFREQLDWPAFSFAFAPDQVGPGMISALRAVPQPQLEAMQVKQSQSLFLQKTELLEARGGVARACFTVASLTHRPGLPAACFFHSAKN